MPWWSTTRRYLAKAVTWLAILLFVFTTISGSAAAAGVDGSGDSTEDTNALIDDYPGYVPDSDSCTDSGTTTSTTAATNATVKNPVSLPSSASLDQKIGQTLIVGFDASTPKSVIEDVATKYHIGGIYLTGTSDAEDDGFTASFFKQLGQDAGVSLMVTSDEEGGEVQRFSYPDIMGGFPSAQDMGSLSDDDVQQLGETVGADLVKYGVTTDLGPVLDLDDGKNIISQSKRSFSNDPSTVVEKAGSFAQGLELSGITPTYKHFPGFGGAGSGDTDSEPVTVPSSYNLQQNESIYKQALANDNQANVMLSNLYIPGFTKGLPASLSPDAVNYLRNTLNFKGLITTDSLSVFDQASYQNAGKGMSIGAAVSSALQAGVDMPLFSLVASDKATAEAKMDAIFANVKANVPTKTIEAADTAVIAAKNSTPASANNSDLTGTSSGGCCEQAGTQLTGSSAEIQVYNYLIGKKMTPAGAAGVIGNLLAESGIQPERLQGTISGQQTPAATLTSEQLSDPDLGWGVAQFTPPNKFVISYAQRKNQDPDDLGTQLDYIWGIISGDGVVDQLNQAANAQDAALVFMNGYEHPEYPGTDGPPREALAAAAYQKLVNGTAAPPNAQPTSPDTISDGCGVSSGSGIYEDPMRDVEKSTGFGQGRIDEGVDYTGSGPIYALGDGKVVLATNSSDWPGGTFINYELTDGPAIGDHVYIAENCTNIQVKAGDTVNSSSVLCTEQNAFPYIETGWAADSAVDLAAAYGPYSTVADGTATAYGNNFNQLLVSLGAPSGVYQFSNQKGGQNLAGTLPKGWPVWTNN